MALRGQTKQLKKEKDDLVQENKELKQANNDLTREKGFFQKQNRDKRMGLQRIENDSRQNAEKNQCWTCMSAASIATGCLPKEREEPSDPTFKLNVKARVHPILIDGRKMTFCMICRGLQQHARDGSATFYAQFHDPMLNEEIYPESLTSLQCTFAQQPLAKQTNGGMQSSQALACI